MFNLRSEIRKYLGWLAVIAAIWFAGVAGQQAVYAKRIAAAYEACTRNTDHVCTEEIRTEAYPYLMLWDGNISRHMLFCLGLLSVGNILLARNLGRSNGDADQET